MKLHTNPVILFILISLLSRLAFSNQRNRPNLLTNKHTLIKTERLKEILQGLSNGSKSLPKHSNTLACNEPSCRTKPEVLNESINKISKFIYSIESISKGLFALEVSIDLSSSGVSHFVYSTGSELFEKQNGVLPSMLIKVCVPTSKTHESFVTLNRIYKPCEVSLKEENSKLASEKGNSIKKDIKDLNARKQSLRSTSIKKNSM